MNLRIGSRGSALARWQAEHVQGRLRALGHEVEIRVIVTTGDRVQDRRLESVGGKGAFLKEIEEAMLRGEVDLAVHSLKDVPVVLPEGLRLCAVLARADPRDVLVTRAGGSLADLEEGATVGTTSLRRAALLRDARPDLRVSDLRGNVDTRLRRLHAGDYDAIVLARAGLERLGRAQEATEALDPRRFVPAPGQGAIALECREDDHDTVRAVAPLDHEPTHRAVRAERAFLEALGGGCNVPLGAHVVLARAELHLVAFAASADGGRLVRGEAWGRDPEELGRGLAGQLRARGAVGRADGPVLAGRRVLVTRRREQAAPLTAALEALGAEVLAVPLLEIRGPRDPGPFARARAALSTYDWLVFTSANAVEALAGHGVSLPPGVRLACVGPSTRAALAERFAGAVPAVEPEADFRAEGLLVAFASLALEGARVLLPLSERARSTLADGLRARGALVDAVSAYGIATPAGAAEALAEGIRQGLDAVTLASPSAASAFAAAAGEAGAEVPAVVIGPETGEAAARAGLRVAAVAEPSTAAGLAAAVARLLTPRP
ncbi:MAG TPA: hydroxymethylbilane synthase [Vicinamibacteria bacterium]